MYSLSEIRINQYWKGFEGTEILVYVLTRVSYQGGSSVSVYIHGVLTLLFLAERARAESTGTGTQKGTHLPSEDSGQATRD